jgi:hypothetical protein
MNSDIDHFRMCQVIGSLSIEVNTGMRHSQGSILKLAQQRYGIKAKNKKKALEEMRVLYAETYGREYGAGAI